MKFAVVCIVLLIAVSQASKSGMINFLDYPLNFSSKRSFMTLLTQVEAKLKAGGPLDQINVMLDEFKSQITDEQIAHDNLYEKQQEECSTEKEFREKEIADAVNVMKVADDTLTGCQAQQVRAQADLFKTKSALFSSQEFLVVVEDGRVRGQAFYEYEISMIQQVLSVVEEIGIALQELLEAEGEEEVEVGFAQIVKKANKALLSSVKAKQMKPLKNLLNSLAQLKKLDPMDETIVKNIITQVQRMKEQYEEFLQLTVDNEEKAVNEYGSVKDHLNGLVAQYNQDINDYGVEIAQLDKCIVTQMGMLNSAKAKFERNSRLNDDANNLCESIEVEYEQATKARKAELKLLSALRERVEARFSQISEGVTERGKLDKDQFEYNNENDYDHKTFTPSD